LSDVNIVAYADDMYFIFEANTWEEVTTLAAKKTKEAIDWLKKSGMVINTCKTEAAYFALRELSNPQEVNIDGTQIELKKTLNVLGLTFDYKLHWGVHVEKILKEANSRTQAIRHLHEHLSIDECLAVAHGLFFSKFYYCSSVWLTDLLPKMLVLRLTTASNSVLRAAFGYRVKDISTAALHSKARILTPYQRSFKDKAMVFWRVVNSCEPENLFLELLNQGIHHERNKTFYLQQNNIGKIGRLSLENRLNNILSLLGDKWLDQSLTSVKKMLNETIKENIPAKCL